MADLEIGVIGAAGRMGAAVIHEICETEGCVLVAAADNAGHPALGEDAGTRAGLGALGIPIGDDPARVFERSSVVIEFSLPDATAKHAAMAGAAATPHVIGTTGLERRPARGGQGRPPPGTAIVLAPNMSLAVNILFALTRQVAGVLDDRFDIEIVEMHHKHKVDAPSGTALGLGRAAAEGRGVALDAVSQMARQGQTGARRQGDIGFAVLRGGRRGRRTYRDVRGRGRTPRAYPQGLLAAHILARRGARGALGSRAAAGPLRNGRRARPVSGHAAAPAIARSCLDASQAISARLRALPQR